MAIKENMHSVNDSINHSYKNNCNNLASKVKRDRSKNFLPVEREQLLQICAEFIDVIENKKTDSYTSKKKYEAWMEIAKKFNGIQTTGVRNDKHLKTLYENIKRDFKRNKNGDKMQLFSSGHYVTSLCNVYIKEATNSCDSVENYEQGLVQNESSNGLNIQPEPSYDGLSVKEEPSEADSETTPPLTSSFIIKDNCTSDCSYNTSQLENLLTTKNCSINTSDICDLPPSTSVESDDTEEYHKARLRFLEIEHKKKMEILDLEQQCLLLKRDLLKAKLEAIKERKN